ncbi:MAG TPA: glycosyltransferase [Bryobacteraceae bacterium]|nr:glycosyltransferase [Bryobacteraceae bacterium]
MQAPRIVFLVNGSPGSAMAIRATSFEERLASQFRIHVAYRSANKIGSIGRFLWTLFRIRPAVCCVFDMAFSGVIAAGLYRGLSRCRVMVDTGDAIYELSKSTGNRGAIALWLTKLLERFSLAIADRLVVRSHPHQELLAKTGVETRVIPDGVDMRQFYPLKQDHLRREHQLDGFTVVGVLGSLVWSPRWNMCYGSELIDVLDQLRDLPVKGLVIGDGSGLPHLKKLCSDRGLEDRIVFAGRLPYNDLAAYINLMDVCISTQTNDLAGQVRTTGMLPLYLACGRFVLATEVGEAARVLPKQMLVPYQGTKDPEYPARLAGRIRELLAQPESLDQRNAAAAIAKAHFDYDLLARRFSDTIREMIPNRVAQADESLAATGMAPSQPVPKVSRE